MASNRPITSIDRIKADADGSIAIGPFGSRMKADCYVPSGVPVIRGNNLSDTRSFKGDFVFISDEMADSMLSCNVIADDLVFPHRGAIGEVGIVPKDRSRYMLSTSLMKLRCNPKLANPKYVYYFFRSLDGKHELLKNASTVGTPGIGQPLSSLRSIKLPLPSIAEQTRIADILGTLDDKIELNRRTNETLEAMAKALFKSWFVDFDPVREKAAGRRPAGLDAATAKLFPAAFEDSPVGPIPKGWKAVPVPDAIEVNPTLALSKGTVAPYLEMANMPTTSARAVAWEDREFGSGMRFQNGDTLMARITPCLENGKTAYVDFLKDDQVGWGSTEYIVLRSKPPLPKPFTYFLARSDDFRAHVIKNMTGTSGRQRAPAECLNAYYVIVPEAAVATRFGEFADHCIRQMKANDEESATLAGTRDALLPKLLSGEVTV